MSPRSEEFMAGAEERLAMATDLIASDHASGAISAAYYAMLYAARAALSERDAFAKTHSGVWSLFSQELVRSGELEPSVSEGVKRARRQREAGDYDAATHDLALASEITADAEAFVAAVRDLLAE